MAEVVATGAGGVLRATVEITRAATGKVEYYDIVGTVDPDDLAAIVNGEIEPLTVHDASGGLTRSVDQTELIDQDAVVDQETVTSVATVDGNVTTRTYSDGTVQRNVWANPEEAQEFADSANSQGGN